MKFFIAISTLSFLWVCSESTSCNRTSDCSSLEICNGTDCFNVLGADCSMGDFCQAFSNLRCGRNRSCECTEGFKDLNGNCTRVLGKACQTEDADCLPANGMICNNTSGTCVCRDGLLEYKDKCLPMHCHEDVPVMPDLHLRASEYKTGSHNANYYYYNDDVQVISDESLHGWHSIGHLRLATSNPGLGYCGTYYPIYMQAPLTSSEESAVQSGTVTVTAKVGGHESMAPDDETELMIRQCGDDTHVKLVTELKYKMSGLCIEDQSVLNISSPIYPYISTRLEFYQSVEQNVTFDIPYVQFQCYGYIASYGMISTIRWYLDGIHLYELDAHAFDSYPRSTITDMQLQYVYGNSPLNKKFDYRLGMERDALLQLYSGIPLGCRAQVNSLDTNCTIVFSVAMNNEGICKISTQSYQRHEMCGVTIIGLTKHGQSLYGRQNLLNYINSYSDTYTVQTQLGTNIPTDLFHEDFTLIADLTVTEANTGHAVWDNYIIPPHEIMTYGGFNYDMRVDGLSTPPQIVQLMPRYIIVSIDDAGEYVLLRSTKYPVEIQIKMDHNTSTSSAARFCAITIRNGNSIYMKNYCDGKRIDGFIYGEEKTRTLAENWSSQNQILLLNGVRMQYDLYSHSRMRLYIDYNHIHESDYLEGLVGFSEDYFVHRNGSFHPNSDGFVHSWKVTQEESLLNPMTHVRYRWSTTRHMLTCPVANKTIPSCVIVHNSTNYRGEHVYTGALDYSSNPQCEITEDGREWKQLTPDYIIRKIKISASIQKTNTNPLLHKTCEFNTADDHLYIIKWLVDDQVIKSSRMLTGMEAAAYTLTELEIPRFGLDSKCRVSVHRQSANGSYEELLSEVNSPIFEPVKILTPSVNFQRESAAAITIEKFVPFGCRGHSEYCSLQFLIHDPDDDYSCANSTVAVKSESLCGGELSGDFDENMSYEKQTISFIITTKNNNQYDLKEAFNLRLKTRSSDKRGGYWDGDFNQAIRVKITDNKYWQGHHCSANNDPRLVTFDRVYYPMQFEGIFVLYKHVRYNAEVHIETELCNWRASCVCGIAARAGKDVYVINNCGNNSFSDFKSRDNVKLLNINQEGNNWEIVFPHGAGLVASTFPWSSADNMNVNLYPAATDVGSVLGLCGNFNGDRSDDFRRRDGSVDIHSDYYYYRKPPNGFSLSWKVGADDFDLIYSTNYTDLESWKRNDSLCVCMDDNHEVPTCDAVETNTCKSKDRSRRSVMNGATFGTWTDPISHRMKLEKRAESYSNVVKRAINENSTSNNISFEAAREMCEDQLANCGTFNHNKTSNLVNTTAILDDCARDQMLDNTVSWFASTCSQIQTVAAAEISRNETFQALEPDVVNEIQQQTCPGACAGNGKCSQGKCICAADFTSTDCGVDKRKKLEIRPIHPVLPLAADSINVYGTGGFSTAAECHIHSFIIKGFEGELIGSENAKVESTYINYYQVGCSLEHFGRTRRSASADGRFLGYQYKVAVSNDGNTFSDPISVTSIDSTCLSSDGLKLTIKPLYCVINGICQKNGTTNPSDECSICMSDNSIHDWTGDDITGICQVHVSEVTHDPTGGLDGLVIAGIIISGILACVIVVVATVYLVHRKKKSKYNKSKQEPETHNDTNNWREMALSFPQ